MTQDIRKVNDIESLMAYFADKLGWDIDLDDFYDIDDITYDFDASDLGLKEEAFAKITTLKQLRPLVDDQRWGIFFVNFESDKFEVSALRKILSGLIPARRNSNHAVWDQNDLLFLCTWGQQNKVTIGAAHFEEIGSGLPQIKMISCEPAVEDFTQINIFEQRLEKLSWPKDPTNVEAWHEAWSSAFTVRYRQTIQDSHTLTLRLAEEAQNIRDRILDILSIETRNGYVHLLFEKFQNTLVHDMTEHQFADMYAQTIVYGLFSARCMDKSQDDFSAAEAVDCIPNTNPFLKSLMQECIGSNNARSKLSFDELEVGNIVELLRHTKTDSIISDFNRQTGGGREDPVIHFYEEFLTEYDKTQKVQRGVYYTPQPVVNFIVRAVDDILRTSFGVRDGLASTETKMVKVTRQSKRRVNGLYRSTVEDEVEVPAIQILDPATGTGTFLRQAILQIYENFCAARRGQPKEIVQAEWNSYVPNHLLPRLNGFELMMAPYAVAHMKLAMVLKDTGYQFDKNERLQVYLTNSLEKPGNAEDQLSLFEDPLAYESISANKVKKNNGINVVLGNPPYAGESSNSGEYILSLMEDFKKEPGGVIKLQEQNSKWINDDYVKFIRYAQHIISRCESGVLAFINPHGFLDNPTFRGMRWFLMQTFSSIYVLDLHGNSKKKEICPDGGKDENVFDIQQGVCIFIGVKAKQSPAKKCRVYHSDLYGLRSYKYDVLSSSNLNQIEWQEVFPVENDFLFIERNMGLNEEWNEFFGLNETFPVNGVGICSKRDPIAYHDERSQLEAVLKDFEGLSESQLKTKYNVTSESRDQKVVYAKENVLSYGIDPTYIRQCLYRPFDLKWTYYTDKVRGFLAYPVYKVLGNMLYDNVGLIVSRQGQASDLSNWNVVFATNKIVDLNIFRRGGGCLFPLYLYTNSFGKISRKPNIERSILAKFSGSLGIPFAIVRDEGDYTKFSPEDFWNYIYAVLHSRKYREKYKEFLNLEFPRIPFISSLPLFWKMVKLGGQLRRIHLMEDQCEAFHEAEISNGSNQVEKIVYKNDRVFINKNQFFAPVAEELWNLQIGGYQPLEKYLKDRKGLILSNGECLHYCNTIAALKCMIAIMDEIDSAFNV